MMAKTCYNAMPYGLCPHCGHEWQIDDTGLLVNGDCLLCPACEGEVFMSEKDVTTTFTMSTEKGESDE